MENDFFIEIGKLKALKRKGWVESGINSPESVADHSFRTAIIASVMCPQELDKNKVLQMALFHELGEIDAGDITPYENITKADKEKKEADCVNRLVKLLGKKNSAQINLIWDEYLEQESGEAKFVKQCDLFEMGLQAYEYEKSQHDNIKNSRWAFFEFIDKRLNDKNLLKLYSEIKNAKSKI
ncbi:MAG: HD domain-containing protein [archaeon]